MKTLVFIRHAHRDTSVKEADNGLSEKGIKQAEKVCDYFNKKFKKSDAHVLSSPKKRCIETVQAIALKREEKVEIDKLLDEQGHDESNSKFFERVDGFLKKFEKSTDDAIWVASSHGDWLPAALEKVLKYEIGMKKGSYIELSFNAARKNYELIEEIQEF